MANHVDQQLFHVQGKRGTVCLRIVGPHYGPTEFAVLHGQIGEFFRVIEPGKRQGFAFTPFTRGSLFLFPGVDAHFAFFVIDHPGQPGVLPAVAIILVNGGVDESLKAAFPWFFRLEDGYQRDDLGFLADVTKEFPELRFFMADFFENFCKSLSQEVIAVCPCRDKLLSQSFLKFRLQRTVEPVLAEAGNK